MKKALIDISGRNNSGPVIAIELAKALAINGFEVYAVVAKDTLNIKDWIDEKSLKDIYFLKTYTGKRNFLYFSIKFHLFEKKKIKEKFKEIQFDYVFKPIFHIWAEDIINQVSKKKIVTLCHDPVMHSGESLIKRFLYKKHIKNSDEVVVLTKSFVPIICQNYGFKMNHIHYMPHGLMKLYREKQNKNIHNMYDNTNINFLFFGRIQKYKGLDILIEAFNTLKKEYNDITLTIAGNGKIDGFEKINKLDRSIRIINEYIPDENVGCYFDGPNVVTVLPYLDATQSGVIPIAIEYGTPIIASDTGGLKEQMLDGKFGVFIEAGNVEDLIEKMKLFIQKREIFEQQRLIMKEAVKELEWKEVVAKLLHEI